MPSVDARDIAAVAVASLTRPRQEGRAYALTGPEPLDHETIARMPSAASGRPIRYVPLAEAAAREALAGAGMLSARIERLVGFYRRVRAGACAPVSADVETVHGRSVTPFEAFARYHSGCWA